MATGVITNRLLDPSGTALSGVTVNARLKPTPSGFRSGTFYEVSQLETTTTDASGDWSLTLEINTDILPGDSYWEVEELIPATAGVSRVWSVQVAAGSNTLYASLVSTPPNVSVPSYITQSTADARYFPYGSLQIGTPQPVGTATVTGTATTVSASNHRHALGSEVYGAGITSVSTTTVTGAGTALTLARSDHLHGPQSWVVHTPTLTQGASTNIAKTVTYSKYLRAGDSYTWVFSITSTGTSTVTAAVTLSTPITPVASNLHVGTGDVVDANVQNYIANVVTGPSVVEFQISNAGGLFVGANPAFQVAPGDQFIGTVTIPVV